MARKRQSIKSVISSLEQLLQQKRPPSPRVFDLINDAIAWIGEVAVLEAIKTLTVDVEESESVTICTPAGEANFAIWVSGAWTNHEDRYFSGGTLLDCF